MKFSIYDKATGKFEGQGSSVVYRGRKEGDIIDIGDGKGVYIGELTSRQKIEDGKVVNLSEAEQASFFTEEQMREYRDILMSKTDWRVVDDSPLSDSKKEEWKTYRQALRDITTHENFPALLEADWPTPPE